MVDGLMMTQGGTDAITLAIAVFLPVGASLVVIQTNPYQALVMRGILGAVAALVYAVLGAADVALTEALVGTMLSITLYAVAVRSSLTLRLAITDPDEGSHTLPPALHQSLLAAIAPYHLRLEILPWPLPPGHHPPHVLYDPATQTLQTSIERLEEILTPALPAPLATVTLTPPTP